MRGTEVGKEVKYKEWASSSWISCKGLLPCKIRTATTVFSLIRQLYISNRRSYVRLYCRLIDTQHLLSEMKTVIRTLALGTPCLARTK
jgi:hypothetical protein